jgi:hypothetical protein
LLFILIFEKENSMRFLLFLSISLVPLLSFAFQCPDYQAFYQDAQNIWHIDNLPPAPLGTFWETIHQGPFASDYHLLNTSTVILTYGTRPERVNCTYGADGAIFLGINLHLRNDQLPAALPGAAFDGGIPNYCNAVPTACQFNVKKV